MKFFDTLANLVSGMGTWRAKSAATTYAFAPMTRAELEFAYRGSWLARKVVDIPALDMCREWRSWQAAKSQIEAIEREERRLALKAKVLEAKVKARLYGGAALLIGDGANDPAQPLDVESIRQGGIRYLTVLTSSRITVGQDETDVASAWYGLPAYYALTNNQAAQVRVHPSRIVRFLGAPVPEDAMATVAGWGDSVLQAVSRALKDAEAVATNVSDLTYEAKIDIYRIPGLMGLAGDAGYEARFMRRMELATAGKSLHRALILDKDEEYEQKTIAFATLPDVLDRFMQIAAGAADIPMTRLLGQSPAGMNATGESDLVNYYDRIGAGQRLELEPAMSTLDECLIRSALGVRPPEIYYVWSPLWQLSSNDRADVRLKQAQAFQIDANTGLIADTALAKGRINQLIEDGTYPGLEKAIAEADAEAAAIKFREDEDDASQPASFTRLNVAANDAEPRPLYVHREVKNGAAIVAWAKSQGFTSTLDASDLHVTIAYSKAPVDWMAVGEAWESEIKIAAGGPRVMEQFGEATVLLIASHMLKWRHEQIREAGASWDHADYQPHITISYGGAPADLAAIKPYQGEIVLGPEVFEQIKEV